MPAIKRIKQLIKKYFAKPAFPQYIKNAAN